MSSVYAFPAIMLVDDSRIDNLINKKVLERELVANHIIVCTSGVEAVDHLRRIDAGQITDEAEIPALIFVDLYMPEMGGRQFLDEFSRFSPRVRGKMRIILFSGSILSQEQRTDFENNPSVLRCITKPLQKKNIEELMAVLRENKED
ncbi:MAG: response regulator [Cytophagales bacterium]|nr:response regulator [Cytophagales bacterium]